MKPGLVLGSLMSVSLAGCMYAPANGSSQENGASVTVSGWTVGAAKPVEILARDWNTDGRTFLGGATSSSTETYIGSQLYPWSRVLPSQPQAHWRPSLLGPGVTVALGRMELSAVQEGNTMLTFSASAQTCAAVALAHGTPQDVAGQNCSDGNTLARFDVSGVDSAPLTTAFRTRSQKTVAVLGQPTVNLRIVAYDTPGPASVYAMICSPADTARHRLMIYNHGGAKGTSVLDAEMCLDHARRGWVFAMSSYRREPLRVPASWDMRELAVPALPLPEVLHSSGNIEVSLGEVMDVHRLLALMQYEPNVDVNKVYMWGFSHGASITLRAVETGARVQAAAAVSPATDWADVVRQCQARGSIPSTDVCYLVLNGEMTPEGQVPSVPSAVGGPPPTPPATGVDAILRSYDWRSPLFFAGDLAIRKDVKLVVQHGLADLIVRPHQSCNLAAASFGTGSADLYFVPAGATAGTAIAGTRAECPGTTFTNTSRPTTDWSGSQRYLLAYAGIGHGAVLGSTLSNDFWAFRDYLQSIW
ncbi:MAG: hypothetical protein U0263_23375 [Polyangiaceae bacterium]